MPVRNVTHPRCRARLILLCRSSCRRALRILVAQLEILTELNPRRSHRRPSHSRPALSAQADAPPPQSSDRQRPGNKTAMRRHNIKSVTKSLSGKTALEPVASLISCRVDARTGSCSAKLLCTTQCLDGMLSNRSVPLRGVPTVHFGFSYCL